ncbi:MAG TPA: DUF3710 domain-containing protein [Streptosporangiaceae bacterium]
MFGRRRREDAEQPGDAGISEQDAGLEDDELDDEYEDYEDEDELGEPEDGEPEDGERDDAPAARRSGPAEDLGDPMTWTRLRDPAAAGSGHGHRAAGPWDAAAGYPESDRMGFGSMLVPAREGFDIHIPMDGESGIIVVYGESALELQAFAAPKRSGLWDEVRQEIAAEVAGNGGRSEEADGPFGPELLARVTPAPDQGSHQPQSLRFLGADGPRWFLRGLLTGPAAQRPELARPFEEIFADVVVVRGEHAEPPRKALDISLPEEARQFIEQQAEADGMPNPFERGPEITEIR